MGTTILAPLSASHSYEFEQGPNRHSEFLAPLSFAMVPLLALATAALLLGHGTISGASLNDAISFLGNGNDCLQNAACP
jgi:hypothetical protein